jgi:hypothetical protein
VRALTVHSGDATRWLDLSADMDGWAVSALEIRNYHRRFGARPLALLLPARAHEYVPASGRLPVALALAFLALAGALVPASRRRSVLLTANGLVLAALLACVTSLILPSISPYRVLFSPAAFALLTAALFAQVLLYAARPILRWAGSLVRAAPRCTAILTRYWTTHAVTFERGAALLALVAIGLAQPVFEVVSNSPEFFAARSTTAATAVATVLAMCLGFPFVLLGVERAVRRASRPAASAFFAVLLALLSAAIVMPWFRRGGALAPAAQAIASGLVGIASALAYARVAIVRQVLTALAPAALIVPAMFLLDPAVARTFVPAASGAAAARLERTPPVVLVVFDELPLNSLLDADRRIDAGLYPNFAALARDAYWFRNATTVSSGTVWAVPAILSGRYPTELDAVPTLRYYPVNLFTALAGRYEIFATLRFQQLCPPRACQYNASVPADSVRSLVRDLGLVWLHIVLPQPVTEALPPVVGDWAEFGGPPAAPATDVRSGRAGIFAGFLSSIDGRHARLHVIHSMLPHMAFEYVPSGRRYRAPDYQTRNEGGTRLFERVSPAYADTLHQRHLAQVGFVDRLVGDLMARLRDVGAYEDALIVITADHGASYREEHARRLPHGRNLSDILRVPLMVKLPGQRRGEIVDGIVETVDILPTILDALGGTASADLDGRSLMDDRSPGRSARTFILRNRSHVARRTIDESSLDPAPSLERKLRRFGSGDWTGLFARPDARHLLGLDANGPAVQPAADVRVTIRSPERFDDVRLARDPLPLYVRGVVDTQRPDPVNVAVAVNGRVAAVVQSYQERGEHVFGTLIPEASLHDGRNTVAAFAIEAAAAQR